MAKMPLFERTVDVELSTAKKRIAELEYDVAQKRETIRALRQEVIQMEYKIMAKDEEIYNLKRSK